MQVPSVSFTRALVSVLLVGALAAVATATAAQEDELITRINEYRSAAQNCEGKRMPAAGPLAPVAALSHLKLSPGVRLQEALKAVGYPAERVQLITVSGTSSVDGVMRFIQQRYCSLLSSSKYSVIGISRQAGTWRIVFAQPLISDDLDDWPSAGREILQQVNTARATPRTCGKQQFAAAQPLTWDEQLGKAALAHSRDMSEKNYFSHIAKDGSDAADRVTRAGYSWQRVGENIAAGQGSAQEVVAGWLSSPGHCANIMQTGFTEMGAAFAIDHDSDAVIYWTQVFGTPR